ncbi:MAG: cytoplasmic protein [Desulfobulbaceae bacterium]|nr:MAG: cytoplasmic protein [Desulfobulbaceae bacterium]
MKQHVFFAFRGDPMCFVHVLLNSLDLNKKRMGGKIIFEGEAVKLVPEMINPDHFLNKLYAKVKEQNLIIGACKACSSKLEVSDIIQGEGIPLIGAMMGHPAISDYIDQEYQILTF